MTRSWKTIILSGAALAFLCKILLALNTWGTNDVYSWERFAHWSRIFGVRLYLTDRTFNHPPSMIYVLHAMLWLARATGIFFPFWLRLPAILADAGSLWIVSRIFAPRLNEPRVRWALLLLAISPVLILVSGFHGNTDPVVIFFLLLSVWLTEKDAPDWASGAALGAAMCVKIVPLIVLPVLFFYRPGLRRRVIFLAAAGVIILVCWSPYLFENPLAIFHQVVGYRSSYGLWGLSWFAVHVRHVPHRAQVAFERFGAYPVLALITAAAFLVNRSSGKPALYRQVGTAFFFFLAASNGFGVQYLAWLVPWTIGLDIFSVVFFQLASSVFVFLVYNYWSGGFPWYLADGYYAGDFAGHLDYFQILSWLSVVALVWASCKVLVRNPQPARNPRLRFGLAFSVLAILLLFYPMARQLRKDARAYPPLADRVALDYVHAREDILLSERLRNGLSKAGNEIDFPKKPDDLRRLRFLTAR